MVNNHDHNDQSDRRLYGVEPPDPTRMGRVDQQEKPPLLLDFDSKLVTTLIFIICSLILVLGNLFALFDPSELAFSPGNGKWFPGLLSHMFTHADYLGPQGTRSFFPMHFLGNMCILVFLGGSVERLYGRYAYLIVFLASGVFAALAQASFDPNSFLIGASGALAGILACFVRHFPKAMILLWFILPMPAWLLALLWISYNIAGAAVDDGAQVAFIAHLGGFVAGGILSYIFVAPGSGQRGNGVL